MWSPPGRVLIIGASFVIVAAGLRAAAEFLGPALLAVLIAIAVQPVIHWFEQHGLPVWISILLVVLGGIIIGTGLITYVSIAIARLASHLPYYETAFQRQLAVLTAGHTAIGLHRLTGSGLVNVSRIFGVLGTFLEILARGLASALLTLLLFVVFSIESPRFSASMKDKIGSESPAISRFSTLAGGISSYFNVRTITNLFMAVTLTVLFWALGVDDAVLWGVLVFFLSYIPSIGLPIALAPAILLAWVQHGVVIAAIAIGGAIIIDVFSEFVLNPRLSGKALNMSTATVIFSFIFWAWIFGAVGALISVPLTAMVMVALDSFDETRWLADLMSANKDLES